MLTAKARKAVGLSKSCLLAASFGASTGREWGWFGRGARNKESRDARWGMAGAGDVNESAPAKLVGGDKVAGRVLGAKELLARGRVAE
jgi:hypothetical protein